MSKKNVAILSLHLDLNRAESLRKSIDQLDTICSKMVTNGTKDQIDLAWEISTELHNLKELRDILYF